MNTPLHRKPLRFIVVLLIKFLQRKYKKSTISEYTNRTTNVTPTLVLIQNILYFFKQHFSAWGYFHPSCVWSENDEKYYRNLFPEINFIEHDSVIRMKPEAVTYYQNKIFLLNKIKSDKQINMGKEIEMQLKKWKQWN